MTTAPRPVALMIYPRQWLEERRKEWGPLTAAACAVGLDAVVSDWEGLRLEGGEVVVRDGRLRRPGLPEPRHVAALRCRPAVVLTTWSVDGDRRDFFEALVSASGCLHTESSLLGWLDGKAEMEACLRAHERDSGEAVPRPETLLWDEVAAGAPVDVGDPVILKPSRGGQCRGIEILPAARVPALAHDAAAGRRPPFVVQRLVGDVFPLRGRRWDSRVHAMATSLRPLRYRVYREGVVKLAGDPARPGSHHLDEWLNAESHLEGVRAADNLSLADLIAESRAADAPFAGLWEQVEEVVAGVFRAIAGAADRWPRDEGAVLFPGVDLIVERRTDGPRVLLLEVNSHPGLGWEGPVATALARAHRAWFADLAQEAARRAAPGAVASGGAS